MSNILESRISPTSPVVRSAPVQPVRRDAPTNAPDDARQPKPSAVVASTGGSLRPAYAQYIVDPTTHDTVVRIRDTNTGAVISESPSVEIQAMMQTLKAYANTVAGQQAARHSGAAH